MGVIISLGYSSLYAQGSVQATPTPNVQTTAQPAPAEMSNSREKFDESKVSRLLVRLQDKEDLRHARTDIASVEKCMLGGYLGVKDAFLVYVLTTDKNEVATAKKSISGKFNDKVVIEEVSADELKSLRAMSAEIYKQRLQQLPPPNPETAPAPGK